MKKTPVAAAPVLVWPALGFPLFFLISITYDTILGERLLLFTLRYGSRSELLWTTLSDWAQALPYSYLIAAATGAPVYAWARVVGRNTPSVFIGLSAAICALAAYVGTGLTGPVIWIGALTGLVWATSLAVAVHWMRGLNP